MSKLKILILTDGLGWIVDRISEKFKENMPYDTVDIFTMPISLSCQKLKNLKYKELKANDLLAKCKDYDIVLFNNWDLREYSEILNEIKIPKVMYFRSFRYDLKAIAWANQADLIICPTNSLKLNLGQNGIFEKIIQIPDGIEETILEENRIVAGYVGSPHVYKGCDIIAQACDELKIKLALAIDKRLRGEPIDLTPDQMFTFYRNIDVLICMSEAEGYGHPVMEAYISGVKHIISTRVGYAYEILKDDKRFIWVNRDKDSLKQALQQVTDSIVNLKDLNWQNITLRLRRVLYDLLKE